MPDDKKKKKKSTKRKSLPRDITEPRDINTFVEPKPKPKPKPKKAEPACDIDALRRFADLVDGQPGVHVTVWCMDEDFEKLKEGGYIRLVPRNLKYRAWMTPKGAEELKKAR